MPSIELADVRIHYKWDGSEGQPVLLLSSGLGTNLSMWDPQISAFAEHFRILRYDPRGHGESSVPPGPYTVEQMGRDAIALLDALGIESFYFCGLSMGGAVGQWLGANAASRIRKLTLCNTADKIGTAESWNARIEAVEKKGLETVIPMVLDRWFSAGFQARNPEVVARTRAMFLATDPAGYVAGCAAIRDMDQREGARHIAVPALVIAGRQDTVTPPAEGKYLAENIVGARYVEFDSAHLSNIEVADKFTGTVLEFLSAS